MKISWKEIFKFLSGAAFVGAAVNFYLSVNNISVPFLGFTITPQLLALRGLGASILFLLFFYFGFLKK